MSQETDFFNLAVVHAKKQDDRWSVLGRMTPPPPPPPHTGTRNTSRDVWDYTKLAYALACQRLLLCNRELAAWYIFLISVLGRKICPYIRGPAICYFKLFLWKQPAQHPCLSPAWMHVACGNVYSLPRQAHDSATSALIVSPYAIGNASVNSPKI